VIDQSPQKGIKALLGELILELRGRKEKRAICSFEIRSEGGQRRARQEEE
jgi:hypothetical protein